MNDPQRDSQIALPDAVKEFGPCAGGYAHARLRILREIASNTDFGFELCGDLPAIEGIHVKVPTGSREWFGEVAELLPDNPLPLELPHWLVDRDVAPKISLEQVKVLWLPTQPDGWSADSDLNPIWDEPETLAWISTRDSYVVGLAAGMRNAGKLDEFAGLLGRLTAERCLISHHKDPSKPAWQACHCLAEAWDHLRRFARVKALSQGNGTELRYDTANGRIELGLPANSSGQKFLKKHVFQTFPIEDESLALAKETLRLQGQTKTGAAGRPSKGKGLYIAEFHRRVDAGEWNKSLSDESRYLHAWFQTNHPAADLPTHKTIENTIRKVFNEAKARISHPQNTSQK